MSDVLTTGPFIVPAKVTGDPAGSNPNDILITIKNPTTKDFSIKLFADICTAPSASSELHFSLGPVTIASDSCFSVTGPIVLAPGYVVRITFKGDIDEKAKHLEATVVGIRTSDSMHEPTMYFRHHDLVEEMNSKIHVEQVLFPDPSSNWVQLPLTDNKTT